MSEDLREIPELEELAQVMKAEGAHQKVQVIFDELTLWALVGKQPEVYEVIFEAEERFEVVRDMMINKREADWERRIRKAST